MLTSGTCRAIAAASVKSSSNLNKVGGGNACVTNGNLFYLMTLNYSFAARIISRDVLGWPYAVDEDVQESPILIISLLSVAIGVSSLLHELHQRIPHFISMENGQREEKEDERGAGRMCDPAWWWMKRTLFVYLLSAGLSSHLPPPRLFIDRCLSIKARYRMVKIKSDLAAWWPNRICFFFPQRNFLFL